MAVFQIFQDRFFQRPLISTQEGVLKTYILVSSLLASKNHLSVSILGVLPLLPCIVSVAPSPWLPEETDAEEEDKLRLN